MEKQDFKEPTKYWGGKRKLVGMFFLISRVKPLSCNNQGSMLLAKEHKYWLTEKNKKNRNSFTQVQSTDQQRSKGNAMEIHSFSTKVLEQLKSICKNSSNNNLEETYPFHKD